MRLKSPFRTRRFAGKGLYTRAGVLLLAITFSGVVVWAQSSPTWFGFNAESGSLSGQTQVVSDPAAANGSALTFTNSTGGSFSLPNPGSWSNVTGNMSNMQSDCGNLTNLWFNPVNNNMMAGVAASGLWTTSNNGNTWTRLGGTTTIDNRPTKVVFDPAHPGTYWEAGIYNGPTGNWIGVQKTTDGGTTFQRLGDIVHIDDIGVDFSDPNRQTIIATGHETSRKVYKTTNGGTTWSEIGQNLPAGTSASSSVLVFDTNNYIVNVADYGGGTTGIYRTTNGGTTWTRISPLSGRYGRPFTVAPNGNIYIPTWGHPSLY